MPHEAGQFGCTLLLVGALGGLVAGQALGVDHGFLEHLERRGHAADLVVAAETRHLAGEIMRRETGHDTGDRGQRPGDAVAHQHQPADRQRQRGRHQQAEQDQAEAGARGAVFGPRDHVGERGLCDDHDVVGADKLTIAVVDACDAGGLAGEQLGRNGIAFVAERAGNFRLGVTDRLQQLGRGHIRAEIAHDHPGLLDAAAQIGKGDAIGGAPGLVGEDRGELDQNGLAGIGAGLPGGLLGDQEAIDHGIDQRHRVVDMGGDVADRVHIGVADPGPARLQVRVTRRLLLLQRSDRARPQLLELRPDAAELVELFGKTGRFSRGEALQGLRVILLHGGSLVGETAHDAVGRGGSRRQIAQRVTALQAENHERIGQVAAGDRERDDAVAVRVAGDRELQRIGADDDEDETERPNHRPEDAGDRTLLLHRLIHIAAKTRFAGNLRSER